MPYSLSIKRIRNFIDFSQEEFGSIFGVTRAVIRDYESGKTIPKKIFLDKIALIFNIGLDNIENLEIDLRNIERPSQDLLLILQTLNSYRLQIATINKLSKEILNLTKKKINHETIDEVRLKILEKTKDRELFANRELWSSLNGMIEPYLINQINFEPLNIYTVTTLDFFKTVQIFKDWKSAMVKDSNINYKRERFSDKEHNNEPQLSEIDSRPFLDQEYIFKEHQFLNSNFSKYITKGNFKLFELMESDTDEEDVKPQIWLAELVEDSEPYNYFPYIVILETKTVFAYLYKQTSTNWLAYTWELKKNLYIKAESVKELWLIRRRVDFWDCNPQIFDINEAIHNVDDIKD